MIQIKDTEKTPLINTRNFFVNSISATVGKANFSKLKSHFRLLDTRRKSSFKSLCPSQVKFLQATVFQSQVQML